MNLKKCCLPAVLGLSVVFVSLSCAPSAPPAPGTGSDTGTTSTGSLRPPQPRNDNGLPAPQAGDVFQERLEDTIASIKARDVLTTNGFWTVFHGILGVGPELKLKNEATGEQVNALDYICKGENLRGQRFILTPHGLDVLMDPSLQFVAQGHKDQFIAEMAQWGIPADHKFIVNGKTYVFTDFVRHAQAVSRTKSPDELSWAIIVIADYIGLDATWTNAEGDKLSLEDCLRYELKQPIVGAACGGTHRLFGLAWVYQRHLLKGGKTEGVWKELHEHQQRYIKLAKDNQNVDGSFSTLFFEQRSDVGTLNTKISTTGHTLEWLALTLPEDELRAYWVQRAVDRLTQMIAEAHGKNVEGGSLYHATHGLIMYHARLYDRERLKLPFPRGVPLPLPPGYQSPVTQSR